MRKYWLLFLFPAGIAIVLLCLPAFLFSQTVPFTCKDLSAVNFYSYPINDTAQFYSKRVGNIEVDYNLNTGDTSIWEMEWKSNCTYILKFVSGTKVLDKKLDVFLRKHELVYKVEAITKDYYAYKAYLDKVSKVHVAADTAWFQPKQNPSSAGLFKLVSAEAAMEDNLLTDSSNYALLYLYRPGKNLLLLTDYFVYANEIPLCIMSNKKGYVFKILKEGPLNISSRLFKDLCSVSVDIKFGQRYFVKPMVIWGIYKPLINGKLKTYIVPEDVGREEFKQIHLVTSFSADD